ncbi:MAG: PfkB family carbohydrate kinase [Candidatus Sulfobium sp.]|jgi:sulfofructose kinase
MHVTGLGQCSLDYLALVDAYPGVDTKKEVLEWHEQGGGPVATALVALSRLGIDCRFYGVTGDDPEGKEIRQSLVDEGVDVKGLKVRKNSSSQIAFIAVEEGSARRTVFWKRPSGKAVTTEEIGDDFFEGCDFLLLDGLMKEASLQAAKGARRRNIPVMLDAGSARPGLLEIAAHADYLVASGTFAKGSGWDLSPEFLAGMKNELGLSALTVTLGENGSITVSDDAVDRVPAFAVHAVDTTGAGDVFHGGYIYGLLRGWTIRNTVTFASALAAMKCRKMGGREGIPGLDEVRAFLKQREHMI